MKLPCRRGCRTTWLWTAALLVVFQASTSPVRAQGSACPGDCNGDAEVTVDELITLVNIALDSLPLPDCRAGDVNADGQVAINEIVAAVNAALNGCPAPPTATPTAILTRAPTSTPPPTPTTGSPHITIGSATGAPGSAVTVMIALTKNGPQILGIAPLILDYDPAVVHFSSCQGTPAIGSKNAVSVGTQLPGRLTVVLTGDVITIPDGDIIACTFAIDVDAAPGASPLTFISADLADDHFDDFFATGTNGSVTVLP